MYRMSSQYNGAILLLWFMKTADGAEQAIVRLPKVGRILAWKLGETTKYSQETAY